MGSVKAVISRMQAVKEYVEDYYFWLREFEPAPPEDDPEYENWLGRYKDYLKYREKKLWSDIFRDLLGTESVWNVPRDGLDFLYSEVEVGATTWGFGWYDRWTNGGKYYLDRYDKWKELDKPISLARALGYDSFYYELTKIPTEKRFMYICVSPLGACVDGVYFDLGNYWIDVCNKDMVEIVGGLFYKFTDVYPIKSKTNTFLEFRRIGEIIKDVKESDA